METFSIRDLRERTGDLVRTAESGHLSVIAKHGRPLFVAVPLDEYVLNQGITVAMACRMFADHVLSLSKAARMANIPVETFIERLGEMGIPAVDYSAEELDRELENLAA
ncbi:MAG: type II toxin-antitoxin system prevent-host-death family antitoxin [Gallionellaceae bacterium]